MAEPATRVALLARPGAACDNLQAALRQAGADVVAVQDPGDGDPSAIAAAHPAAVLVALEPAVEEALDRYDAVLSEPGRLVIYDEVAIAARREGWDAARWARHLAAKLGGHADVLPPGTGDDDHLISVVRSAQTASPALLAPAPPAPPAPPVAQFADADSLALEAMEFDADAVHLGIDASREEALAQVGDGIDFGAFTPEIMAAMTLEGGPDPVADDVDAPAADAPAVDVPATDGADAPAPSHAAIPDIADPNVLEWEVSVPAATPAPVDTSVPEPEPESAAPAPVRFNLDEMSLVGMEPEGQPAETAPASASASVFAAAVMPAPTPAFVPSPASRGGEGAVILLAGIGGPDAVRQVLAGLPDDFARPVIVRQRLDGGRHDRLVRQMQRATALPVELAEAGGRLIAGHVYILPDEMTAAIVDGAASFVATSAPVPALTGLKPEKSAVLVLSGSDPAAVPELMDAARAGALVAGQSPEDSFDGAAATALVAAGGESHAATELAQRLSTRWRSLED